VETSSQPTSDPEERKKHVTTITVSVLCMHWYCWLADDDQLIGARKLNYISQFYLFTRLLHIIKIINNFSLW
jgi:hypothetical protein